QANEPDQGDIGEGERGEEVDWHPFYQPATHSCRDTRICYSPRFDVFKERGCSRRNGATTLLVEAIFTRSQRRIFRIRTNCPTLACQLVHHLLEVVVSRDVVQLVLRHGTALVGAQEFQNSCRGRASCAADTVRS